MRFLTGFLGINEPFWGKGWPKFKYKIGIEKKHPTPRTLDSSAFDE
jgi:hypothetical protein